MIIYAKNLPIILLMVLPIILAMLNDYKHLNCSYWIMTELCIWTTIVQNPRHACKQSSLYSSAWWYCANLELASLAIDEFVQKLDCGLKFGLGFGQKQRWMATISKYRLVGIGRLCTMWAKLVNKAYDTAILATNINHL